MANRLVCLSRLLLFTVVLGLVWLGPASRGEGAPPGDGTRNAAGKNPFAALLSQTRSEEPNGIETPKIVEPPELTLDTIVLKFLEPKSLKGAVDKMVSLYGSVAINEKTNSIIICDTSENVKRIVAEIKKADQTPLQVMVEVVILDVQLRDDSEIGVNWDLLSSDLEDITYRQNLSSERLTAIGATSTTLGNATAYNSAGMGGDFSVLSSSVRNVLHLIQEKRNAEILASPRALVVSGESATIKAVEEIPYQEIIDTATGGANAMTSTKFKEVGVTLQVGATVTDGNNIFLKVQTVQNVTIGDSPAGVPVVDTREANTCLLLRDSQTVVMGGLRREEKKKQVHQIPILGDIPLIGLLFRDVITASVCSELVVLLSPHIYRGEPVPGEVTAKVDALGFHSPLHVEVTAPASKPAVSEAGTQGEPSRKEN
jgi:protein transport protein HofQ